MRGSSSPLLSLIFYQMISISLSTGSSGSFSVMLSLLRGEVQSVTRFPRWRKKKATAEKYKAEDIENSKTEKGRKNGQPGSTTKNQEEILYAPQASLGKF